MPDIYHVDQLAIIIRYVSERGIPTGRFHCFLLNVNCKAGLFNTVTAVFNKCRMDVRKLERAVKNDNASNMSRVQARIKEITYGNVLYLKCSFTKFSL